MNRFSIEHELRLAQHRQQRLLQDQEGFLHMKRQRKAQESDEAKQPQRQEQLPSAQPQNQLG